MTSTEIIEKLDELIQIDHDAVLAYDQAIAQIDVLTIRSQLSVFRGDHRRHIGDLSRMIVRLGGTPRNDREARPVEVNGIVSLLAGENEISERYERALELPLPANVRAVVARHRDDERMHVSYIERVIDELDIDLGSVAAKLDVR